MSGGYAELRDMGAIFRPPDTPLPPAQNVYNRFDARWGDTVDLLARELRHLRAERIVIEIDGLAESDLRLDGIPRAQARLGDAVRVSFDSIHGPLRYETGRFCRSGYRDQLDGWQANIRAIALGLEALRKVERYGITKRGEQYTGWRQLPVSTDPADAIHDPATACDVLFAAAGVDRFVVTNPEQMRAVVIKALKATHPDRRGDETEFRKVQRAREVLGV